MASGRSSGANYKRRDWQIAAVSALSNQSSPHRIPPGSGYSPILDWFHIGMRVEQLSQTARGFRGTYECLMTKEKILKNLSV